MDPIGMTFSMHLLTVVDLKYSRDKRPRWFQWWTGPVRVVPPRGWKGKEEDEGRRRTVSEDSVDGFRDSGASSVPSTLRLFPQKSDIVLSQYDRGPDQNRLLSSQRRCRHTYARSSEESEVYYLRPGPRDLRLNRRITRESRVVVQTYSRVPPPSLTSLPRLFPVNVSFPNTERDFNRGFVVSSFQKFIRPGSRTILCPEDFTNY